VSCPAAAAADDDDPVHGSLGYLPFPCIILCAAHSLARLANHNKN